MRKDSPTKPSHFNSTLTTNHFLDINKISTAKNRKERMPRKNSFIHEEEAKVALLQAIKENANHEDGGWTDVQVLVEALLRGNSAWSKKQKDDIYRLIFYLRRNYPSLVQAIGEKRSRAYRLSAEAKKILESKAPLSSASTMEETG